MSAVIEARLGLILTELRLPTVKRLALDLCTQRLRTFQVPRQASC